MRKTWLYIRIYTLHLIRGYSLLPNGLHLAPTRWSAVCGVWSFSVVSDEWCGGCLLGLNNGCGPRIPCCTKMKIYRMFVLNDMAGVSCSKMLHQRTPHADSCLEITGSDRILSYAPISFIWPFGFKGSTVKLCWVLPSCGMIFRSVVKSASGECHGSQDIRTRNGVSSLRGDRHCLGDSWLGAATSKMGAATHEKFKVMV
jgi:hypothetical protein